MDQLAEFEPAVEDQVGEHPVEATTTWWPASCNRTPIPVSGATSPRLPTAMMTMLAIVADYPPGVANTNTAMKAMLMNRVASTRLTVMKNGVNSRDWASG